MTLTNEEIYALDEKRTQGDILHGGEFDKYATTGDCQFIAAAPQMVQRIREQEEEIKNLIHDMEEMRKVLNDECNASDAFRKQNKILREARLTRS